MPFSATHSRPHLPLSIVAAIMPDAARETPMPPQQPLSDLPFVREVTGLPTQLWVATPTGAWAADNATGHGYADVLLAYIEATGNLTLLGFVVKAIGQSGQWSGIEAGFFHRLAERASGCC